MTPRPASSRPGSPTRAVRQGDWESLLPDAERRPTRPSGPARSPASRPSSRGAAVHRAGRQRRRPRQPRQQPGPLLPGRPDPAGARHVEQPGASSLNLAAPYPRPGALRLLGLAQRHPDERRLAGRRRAGDLLDRRLGAVGADQRERRRDASQLPLVDDPGSYQIDAGFSGDATLGPASASTPFSIGTLPTALNIQGGGTVLAGNDTGITATLTSGGVGITSRRWPSCSRPRAAAPRDPDTDHEPLRHRLTRRRDRPTAGTSYTVRPSSGPAAPIALPADPIYQAARAAPSSSRSLHRGRLDRAAGREPHERSERLLGGELQRRGHRRLGRQLLARPERRALGRRRAGGQRLGDELHPHRHHRLRERQPGAQPEHAHGDHRRQRRQPRRPASPARSTRSSGLLPRRRSASRSAAPPTRRAATPPAAPTRASAAARVTRAVSRASRSRSETPPASTGTARASPRRRRLSWPRRSPPRTPPPRPGATRWRSRPTAATR